MRIGALGCEGIDFNHAFESGALRSRVVHVDAPSLAVYRNRQLKEKKEDKPLITEVIRSSKLPLQIDTLRIKQGQIRYREQYGKGQIGKIEFTQLNGLVRQIYSDSKQPIWITAETLVQSQGKLNVKIQLGDELKKAHVEGRLGSLEFSKFNDITVPIGGISITSGRLNYMDFDFSYTNAQSNGVLVMDYSNLKIAMQDAKTGNAKFFDHLGSLFANTFKVRTYNEASNNNSVNGTIHFKRDKTKSEIAYWWKSIFSGIKSTVWISQ